MHDFLKVRTMKIKDLKTRQYCCMIIILLFSIVILFDTVYSRSVFSYNKKASVNGKYKDLQKVINCSKDKRVYGSFRDWGYWSGTQWCGEKVKPGYWVWVSPNWYIWNKKKPIDISKYDKNKISEAAVGEKYSNLIQIMKCPKDERVYGNFRDWGYWSGGRWCGQQASAGYWVWVSPHWYVWKKIHIVEKKFVEPSVNGKYKNIVQALYCPRDKKHYGLYKDWGYWRGGRWCNQQAKAGYWVWMYPYWYVWEKK